MFGTIAKKLFGSSNDRRLKTYAPKVAAIGKLEPQIEALTDEELRRQTEAFREELAKGKTLDDILVPAFATVREAARRVLGQRHFDVQLIGGMVLHEGGIAEMRTGEGKTLVATLAVYLNALAGKGVHVVTVNDYLARRDAEWMGRVYKFLGMSVGIIVHGIDDEERRAAYASDITYGTNNEFGFDYLRDNMKYQLSDMVQRGHAFAIVDEVDSILIDEARTPLIISGPSDDKSELYNHIDTLIPRLVKGDFDVDEKQRTVSLTEVGNEKIEEWLREAGLLTDGSLYDAANVTLVHHVQQALKAHKNFQRDKDYIVRFNPQQQFDEVVIIDEFTGRMMPGRRYSEGLHQALEAKEHVPVQPENATLASITFQNYFRLYEKLAGMTGTASTEADEFAEIYKLEVVEIPTNRPVLRHDEDDEVYRTEQEKLRAVVREIEAANAKMQPSLVGTTSIEKSEELGEFLKSQGYTQIDFEHPEALKGLYAAAREGRPSRLFAILNARFHEQEAYIVAEAGVPGAITIATNMAGRGTDIQLGGNVEMRVAQELKTVEDEAERAAREEAIRAEVASLKEKALAAGGLFIIGTERHESRRIDNQLRGRGGRQGDPGRSKFFLSTQDDLMRIFGGERMDAMLTKLGLQQDEAIVHSWVNKALEKAQQKVEARNFDIRKNILKYDDVMNAQRKVVFERRRELMDQESVEETISDMRHGVIEDMVSRRIPKDSYAEAWDVAGLKQDVMQSLNLDLPVDDWAKEEGIGEEEMEERVRKAADAAYAERVERVGPETMRSVEKQVVLQALDHLWQEHLVVLDHLRQVIGYRGYAQRDPLNEYKSEAFDLFRAMMAKWDDLTTGHLNRVELQQGGPPQGDVDFDPLEQMGEEQIAAINAAIAAGEFSPEALTQRFAALPGAGAAPARDPNDPSTWGRVSRNEPCPCGSGKKYKHCHGALA